MTFAKFKRDVESRFPGAVLENMDGCAYHLTAPPGHTWDGDLHEFVAQCRGGLEWPRDLKWEADARADLLSRIENPVPCTHPACDWCRPVDEE